MKLIPTFWFDEFSTFISIRKIIEKGMENGEFKNTLDPQSYAVRIDTMIQGATFMTYIMDNEQYMKDTMDQIQEMIHRELII